MPFFLMDEPAFILPLILRQRRPFYTGWRDRTVHNNSQGLHSGETALRRGQFDCRFVFFVHSADFTSSFPDMRRLMVFLDNEPVE